jgi:hypothetical protein
MVQIVLYRISKEKGCEQEKNFENAKGDSKHVNDET